MGGTGGVGEQQRGRIRGHEGEFRHLLLLMGALQSTRCDVSQETYRGGQKFCGAGGFVHSKEIGSSVGHLNTHPSTRGGFRDGPLECGHRSRSVVGITELLEPGVKSSGIGIEFCGEVVVAEWSAVHCGAGGGDRFVDVLTVVRLLELFGQGAAQQIQYSCALGAVLGHQVDSLARGTHSGVQVGAIVCHLISLQEHIPEAQ